jgi:hypothetical protein
MEEYKSKEAMVGQQSKMGLVGPLLLVLPIVVLVGIVGLCLGLGFQPLSALFPLSVARIILPV